MSLRVWLPLTKDLRQQGIANTSTITLASGNAFVDGGKVGNKALHLTKQQTILGTSSCMSGKKQMSYAFWVKVNTAWSAQWLDSIAWYSTDGSSAAYSRQEFYTNCTRIGTWFSGSSLSGYVFTPGEWTHIAGTFDYTAGIAKFYINGVLQGTSTSLSKTHYCRGDFYIGDNGVDIVENDVRIYDHCLSPMEVKELAKGLVLHYPLNRQGWGQENLILHTHFNESDWWTNNTSSAVVSNNKVTIQAAGEFYQKYGSLPTTSIPANTQLTLSCYFYENTISTGNHRIYYASSPSWKYITVPANFTGLFTSTFTTTEKLTRVTIDYDTRNMTSGKWVCSPCKLEYGNKATPWCPNTSDALATTMGLNSTIEYDCSGFCNNGIRYGTFSWTSDTPKYQVSTSLSGNNNWIQASSLIFNIKEAITVNIWAYKDDWSSSINLGTPFSCIQNGGVGWSADSSNAYMNVYCGTGTSSNSYAKLTTTKSKLTSGWHMLTLTYDGLVCKSYIDGVLDQSLTKYTTKTPIYYNTSTGVFIGGEADDSTTTPKNLFKGKVSDLRIYATALSASDVKSLYQNSAYIDSSGNVYGAVHSEV